MYVKMNVLSEMIDLIEVYFNFRNTKTIYSRISLATIIANKEISISTIVANK